MDTNGRTMETEMNNEQEASNSLSKVDKDEEEELAVICDGSNPYKKVKVNVGGDSKRKDPGNANHASEEDKDAEKGDEAAGGHEKEKKKKKKKKSKKKEKGRDDDDDEEAEEKREKKKSEKDGTKKKHKENAEEKEGKDKEKKKKKKKKENEDDDNKEKKKKNKKKKEEEADQDAKEKERRKKRKKEKALEAYQKKVQEFERRYPKFMQKGKIKFPIDDTLFMLYDTILSEHVPKTKKPVPKDGLIPPGEFGDILQVWNFYTSFPELFTFKGIQQEEIYAALKYEGQEHMNLIDYFHQEILIFFVKDFIKKNKFETFKDEIENPFFVLIKYYAGYENPQSDELTLVWTELLRKLTSVAPYGEQLTGTAKKHVQIVADYTTLRYNKLEYKTKIRVLLELINLAYESETFRDCLQEKMDRATALSKERNELLAEIKQEEQETYDLKAKIELAEKVQKEEEEKWEQLPRVEVIKRQKDTENERKELQKTLATLAKVEASLQKKLKRVEEISSSLNLTIETATRLGLDANKSEYWIFAGQPDRLYVKMSPIVYTEDTWRYFDEKEQLDTLLEALNLKGIKERQLSEKLRDAIANGHLNLKSKAASDEAGSDKETEQGNLDLNYWFSQVIKYTTPVEPATEIVEAGRATRRRMQEQVVEKVVKKRQRELKHLTLDGVKELIDATEENLTEYLDMWNARWAHPKIKEDLKKRIKEASTAKELAALVLELEKNFQFSETPLRQKTLEGEANADEGEQQEEDYEDHSEEEEEEEEEAEAEAEEEKEKEKEEDNDEEKRSSDHEHFYGEEEDDYFDNRKIKKKKDRQKVERNEDEIRKEESEGKSEEDHRMEEERSHKEDKNREEKTEDTNKMNVDEKQDEKKEVKQNGNKKEDEPQEKVKKMSLKIWGRVNERIKRCWVAYTKDVDNICGLFLATSIFCEFVDNYLEKKRAKYFSNFKNVAEYMAAKKEKKVNAMASRNSEKRQHNQQQYLEKLKQDREIRRQNYAMNRYVAQHNKYRESRDSESPEEVRIKKKPGFAKESNAETNQNQAKSAGTGDNTGKRIRKLREKSSDQSESEAEYDKPKQQDEKARSKQEKINELLGVRRSTRLTRRVELSEPDEDETYEPKNCCICRRSGEVVLCAMCESAYHLDCVGLKSMPEDKWTCFTCLQKLASTRQTRSTTRKLH